MQVARVAPGATSSSSNNDDAAAAAGKKNGLAGVGLAFYSQIYALKVPIARLTRLGHRSDQHHLSLPLPLPL